MEQHGTMFYISLYPSKFASEISWLKSVLNPSDPSLLPRFPVNFAIFCANYFASATRILLAVVFLGSFLVKPLVMRPLSLVWRRVVESEKPIFTLSFGGVASAAVFVSKLVEHM
jgi:hypothetical protein